MAESCRGCVARAFAAWVLVGALASAQSVMIDLQGSGPLTIFGASVRSTGDIDGDGLEDLLVGEPGYSPGGIPDAGRIRVFSLPTQAVLVDIVGTQPAMGTIPGGGLGAQVGRPGPYSATGAPAWVCPVYGWSGFPIAAAGVHWVFVYSSSGSLLGQWPAESGTGCVAGDLNADGIGDLLIGQPSWYSACGTTDGRLDMIDGSSGSIGASWPGPFCNFDWFGLAVEPLGDISGNGDPDFVVSTNGDGLTATFPRVHLFSGVGSTPVWTSVGPTLADQYASLALAGDVNGDGVDDVVGGAPFYSGPILGAQGRVRVFSGVDGTTLYTFDGTFNSQYLGYAVGRLGDLDGDGRADVLASGPRLAFWSPPTPTPSWPAIVGGHVFVYSGASGSVLVELTEPSPGQGLGNGVDGLGDLDADDYPDFAVGQPWFIPPEPGHVKVYSGAPAGVNLFGSGCAGSSGVVPRIAVWPAPTTGTTANVHLSRTLPSTTAVLLAGVSNTTWGGTALPMSLAFAGLPGCAVNASPDVILGVSTQGPGNGKAYASRSVTIPANPALVGQAAYLQWYVVDPGPAVVPGALSRGLQVTIQ